MKKGAGKGIRFNYRLFLFVLLAIFQITGFHQANAQSDIWVSAYYAGWSQGCGYEGHLQPDQIDFSAVTHVIHFALIPNTDGSLDYSSLCISPENSADLIQAAHAAGKKVLISIGGWQTESGFLGATSSANRARFIQNLLDFITSRGYDGIDVDWEPISSSSYPRFKLFVSELRSALDALSPRPLLTGAAGWYPELFAETQHYFDQINIMTYDLSGPWMGTITWHNSSIYEGSVFLPETGWPAPSVNGEVDDFMANGVEAQKIGIGIAFFGYTWKGGYGTPSGGVTEPGQIYTQEPSIDVLCYHQIMDQFYNPQNYRWDLAAQAAYLSFDNAGSSNDMFISYDDETTCYEKVAYVRTKGIGGMILFELGGGWRPSASVPDLLLQTVKQAAWGSAITIPDAPVLLQPLNNSVNVSVSPVLTWNPSAGADSYAVQVSSTPSFSVLLVNRTGITTDSLAVSGLSSSTTYYWHVKATNTAGSSEWSEIRAFTTLPVSATVISSFTAAPQKRSILLTWQTASEYNNRGFEIERRNITTNNWTKIGFVAGTGTSSVVKTYSFNDKRIIKGNTYGYRLKQMNNDGTYTYSAEVTVKI
jgi:chitinase